MFDDQTATDTARPGSVRHRDEDRRSLATLGHACRRAACALASLSALVLCLPACAGDGKQFQFFLENDILARTDRYYTNGVKIGFGAPSSGSVNDFTRGLLKSLAADGDAGQTGWFFGQNMYTPKNIGIAAPQPDDRPWGAFMYLGAVAQRAHINDRGIDRVDTVEVDLGVIGPAALGEPVQKFVHRLTNSRTPMGWDNQSPTEPAFSVALLRKWKLGRNGYFDVVPHFGLTAGTVTTLARAGGVARLGYGLSGFGVDTVEPGGAILQSTRTEQIKDHRGPFEAYAFAGFDQRLVLWNSFFDGPVFHKGPSVDRKPHVYDVVAGVSMRIFDVVRISVTRVRRSEEFSTVTGGSGGKQIFHSINIGAEW